MDWVSGSQNLLGTILGIVLFGIWVAAIVLIIRDSINILKTDLYEDTGQLLFTVPHSSYSILLSKMLVTVIEVLLFCLLFGILLMSVMFAEGMDSESTQRLMQAIGENMGLILQALFGLFVNSMVGLATIYFALVLAKSLLKNKKYSGFAAFGIFLVMSFFIAKLTRTLFEYIPHYIGSANLTLRANNVMLELPISTVESIGIIILNIIIFTILFVSTGYLLENKADI